MKASPDGVGHGEADVVEDDEDVTLGEVTERDELVDV